MPLTMTRDLLRKVAYEMGWDETSQLDVLGRFIDERKGLPASFEAFLEKQVKAEQEMSEDE